MFSGPHSATDECLWSSALLINIRINYMWLLKGSLSCLMWSCTDINTEEQTFLKEPRRPENQTFRTHRTLNLQRGHKLLLWFITYWLLSPYCNESSSASTRLFVYLLLIHFKLKNNQRTELIESDDKDETKTKSTNQNKEEGRGGATCLFLLCSGLNYSRISTVSFIDILWSGL